MQKPVIIGLGELLWDKFPDHKKPGGAPANVAFNANMLGNTGICVSAVGNDKNGKELLDFLESVNLSTDYIQTLDDFPTGTVSIEFDGVEPNYTIEENVAWDGIDWNSDLEMLSKKASAVCFSTLSQRSKRSRETIHRFLDSTVDECYKVLDLNLRPPFIDFEVIQQSLYKANVVKVNESELEQLSRMLETDSIEKVIFNEFGVKLLCVTLGQKGSSFITQTESIIEVAPKVDSKNGDVVGVGDAFISCIIHHLVKSTSLKEILKKANRFASYMVTKKGAMNTVPSNLLEEVS